MRARVHVSVNYFSIRRIKGASSCFCSRKLCLGVRETIDLLARASFLFLAREREREKSRRYIMDGD